MIVCFCACVVSRDVYLALCVSCLYDMSRVWYVTCSCFAFVMFSCA